MKKVGIIGYGSMGSMLVKRFVSTEALPPNAIMVSTKTKAKLDAMSQEFPGVGAAFNNQDAARFCRILFLCVKPNQAKAVLEEIMGQLHQEAHLVSIVGSVTLADLGKVFPGKISVVMPSLASESGEGLCLVCHNQQVQSPDAKMLEKLISSLGEVKVVPESQFDAVVTLASCGPGLFSSMFQELVRSGQRNGGLSEPEAWEIVARTLLGTARLYCENKLGFEQVIQRVATKGGLPRKASKSCARAFRRYSTRCSRPSRKNGKRRKNQSRGSSKSPPRRPRKQLHPENRLN